MTCNRLFQADCTHPHTPHTEKTAVQQYWLCEEMSAVLPIHYTAVPPKPGHIQQPLSNTFGYFQTQVNICLHSLHSVQICRKCWYCRWTQSFTIHWWALFLSISLLVGQHSSHKNLLAQHTASLVKTSPVQLQTQLACWLYKWLKRFLDLKKYHTF